MGDKKFAKALGTLVELELDTELRMTALSAYLGDRVDEVAYLNYQTLERAAQLIAEEFDKDVDEILEYVFEGHGHLAGYEEART